MHGSPAARRRMAGLSQSAIALFTLLIASLGWSQTQAIPGKPVSGIGGAPGTTRFWVTLRNRPQLEPAYAIRDFAARGQFVVDELHRTAAASQAPLVSFLGQRNAKFKSFWIVNTVWVESDEETRKLIANLPEVESISPDDPIVLNDPPARVSPAVDTSTLDIEWNVKRTHAPEVWTDFSEGEGIVVGVVDTGFMFHPAITARYRGDRGNGAYDHNYNWYDGVPSDLAGCSTAPCDDNGHGTHVTGTIVGRTGSYDIGVAPEARFIACRALRGGVGAISNLLTCYQWFMAPTNLSGGNPDPALRPQIVSQSLGGGYSSPVALASEAMRASGILSVAAAGNTGPNCGTMGYPGGLGDSLAVGALAFDSSEIAPFSSKGPVSTASGLIKPDVVAPGQNVTSAWLNGGYRTISGTSMATPAVSGVAALVMSAAPHWIDHPAALADLLRRTSTKISITAAPGCGPSGSPNMTYGYGEIDAYAAVIEARGTDPAQ